MVSAYCITAIVLPKRRGQRRLLVIVSIHQPGRQGFIAFSIPISSLCERPVCPTSDSLYLPLQHV